MEKLTLLGIDLAKNFFQLHGVDNKGNTVLRKRLIRTKLVEFIVRPVVVQIIGVENLKQWDMKSNLLVHNSLNLS